jgi:hypothetical protein
VREGRLPLWAEILIPIAAAIAGAAVTALITSGDKVVQEKTVPGPTITEYQVIDVGAGVPCSGRRVARQAPYEPNEQADNAYGPLSATEPIQAALESSDDTDFFTFCLKRATEVGVRVHQTECRLLRERFEGDEPDCSPQLELLDDGAETLDNTFVDTEATIGTLEAETRPAGQYYVRLSDGNGFRYRLELRVADASAVSRTLPE